MASFVNAAPAKRFFVEMLIRDIRLEDAILDLVDNAVDSLIRHKDIELESLATDLLDDKSAPEIESLVRISIRDDCFEIQDNCGGIGIEDARQHVFRFGAQSRPRDSRLSVYGIGLKRAVLKIGRMIVVESHTLESGFRVTIDVEKFEASPDDVWHFPMESLPKATSSEKCGTKITVKNLTEEAKSRINSGSFADNLVTAIGQSYSLFLERFVTVEYNKTKVPPTSIPIANSEEITTSVTKESFDGVAVTIVAGLQRLDRQAWREKTAGWYILCNGRVVVFADRSSLTGWGTKPLPLFQPKHRGFIGLALFMSSDPEALPWTTTKRGVNAESAVFQYIKERMISDARPVISFLDSRYGRTPVSSENTDDLQVKDGTLQKALQPVQVTKLLGDKPRVFEAKEIAHQADTISVQYQTERKRVDRARKAIGRSRMAAGRVGLHALNYFIENEAD